MRRALDIYRRLIRVQIQAQMAYPVSFLLDVVSAAAITAMEFASLMLVLGRFEGIGGWTLGEVMFLYGIVETGFGIMDMTFSGFDPPSFGQQVRLGRFDQLLLRPLDVTLQVLGSRLEIRRLGRIALGLSILVAALILTKLRWTLGKVIYLPVVLGSLISFFGGLFIIGATITFWTVESIEAINVLTYGGNEMMSYPMHIYQDWLRRFFTFVVPAIFVNYYPALYFLDKPDPFSLPPFAPFLSPLVGAGTLALALAFWRFGIRHYKSTGS